MTIVPVRAVDKAKRRLLSALLIGCGVAIGCASPTEPGVPGNRVAGAWLANSTLASASGGECVGSLVQAASGRRDVFTSAMRQQGTTLDATVASQGNGTLCAYGGSVSGSSVTLQLSACQAGHVAAVACSDGQLRDVQLTSGTITATVDAAQGTGRGRDVTTWTVTQPGGGTALGTLTVTADFSWIFLGLPSSDYHVFTGTIFPGYADGTISIPADPNAFCAKCGWFVAP